MNTKANIRNAVGLALALSMASAAAAVTDQEAAKLGKELTPVGAERAGNKDGTIPAWTPHVGRELPDLVLGQLAAPRRHSVRPALGDGCGDLVDAPAVAPLVVHQRRPHSASTVAVAADAVHLRIELLAAGDRVGVVVVKLGAIIERGRVAAARVDRRWAHPGRDRLADWLGAAVMLLAVARGERERGHAEEKQASAEA